MTTKTCADIHRELFPTYDALLAECCAKERALIEACEAGSSETALYNRAIDVFGEYAQMGIAQEECGELVAAISQHHRGRISDATLAGEIADVLIMCAQLRLIIGAELVDELVAMKLERLAGRVAGAEGKVTNA